MPAAAAANDHEVQSALCMLLSAGSLSGGLDEAALDALWEQARADDVDVLVAGPLLRSLEGRHPSLEQRLAQRLREAELRSLLRHRELCRVTAGFAGESVPVLLLKGAGLAYTVYPEPHLRPSRDIDLFIRHDSRTAAARALAGCNYSRMREPDGELAAAQAHYARSDAHGINHFIDLHWRVSNARVFEEVLGFDDAWAGSRLVPALEPAARTLGDEQALLLACVHRVAHHQDDPSLLWLWDIHLLAAQLGDREWEGFMERAATTGMRAVSARGLELARRRFGTPVRPEVLERLTAPGRAEPAARFLGGRLRFIDVVRADLAASRRWTERAALLREHLFPSRTYMHALYPRCPGVLLPLAYGDRLIRGAPKWWRRRPLL